MRLRTTAAVAVATAVGGAAAGVLGAVVAITNLDVAAGLLVRAVVGVVVVFVLPLLIVRHHVLADHRRALVLGGLVGLVLGYALNPFAWNGRALAAQAVVEPGLTSVGLDLVSWLVVGGAAVLLASRAAPRSNEPIGYQT